MSKKNKIKKIKNVSIQLRVGILALFILLPQISYARMFDPNNIITDQDLIDKDSLSKTAIQKFLDRENSGLSRFSQIVNGINLSAAEMIWQVSQQHQVNPKFILTNLEKEQSLVQKSQPSQKALDWATGYSCYGGTCKEKYRGFFNQIDAAAETQQIYWQRAGQFSFAAGKTTMAYDGYAVTPANRATANLYIYTPYVGNAPEYGINNNIGGNKLFWRIWNRYFSAQKFLDGQIVQNGSDYWLIANNQKRKFASAQIFLTDHQPSEAIVAASKDLDAYPAGQPITFAEKSLVKSTASGQVYLLAGNTKRPVADDQALALLNNFKIAIGQDDIPLVSEDQLITYSLGSLISSTSVFPQGKLFKDEAGQFWLVQDGLKHLVDSIVLNVNFPAQSPEAATSNQLDGYPTGAPIKLKDGTFVVNNGRYYLISTGARMRIDDPTIFNRIFGPDKRSNAAAISNALLAIHDAGEVIDYIDDTVQDAMVPADQPQATDTYSGQFQTMQPNGLITANGKKDTVTLKFLNTGTATWQPNTVWLVPTDKDKDTSSFSPDTKIEFNEASVAPNQIASFTFDIVAPANQTGLLNQQFTLFDSSGSGPVVMTAISKFIIVKPGVAAQLVSENFPAAVNHIKKPVTVTVKIKNTSSVTWTAKKTALELYTDKGKPSTFYDAKDWIRKDVAATALKVKTVKPGDVATFTFTLDARKLKKGTYPTVMRLHLLDKNMYVYLNGVDGLTKNIVVE